MDSWVDVTEIPFEKVKLRSFQDESDISKFITSSLWKEYIWLVVKWLQDTWIIDDATAESFVSQVARKWKSLSTQELSEILISLEARKGIFDPLLLWKLKLKDFQKFGESSIDFVKIDFLWTLLDALYYVVKLNKDNKRVFDVIHRTRAGIHGIMN